MRHREAKIQGVSDLLRLLKKHVTPADVVWFRGQSDSRWGLVPSLARDAGKHLAKEGAIYKRFVQNATQLMTQAPTDEWDWLFVMQHHRAPTRLLDWSEGPLVALFFATFDSSKDRDDAAFWCLDPIALNTKANVSFAYELELPSFRDRALENYLPSRVDPKSPMNPVAAIGPRPTKRMAAQMGTFTVNHSVHEPIEALYDTKHVWKYIIPKDKKARIRAELQHLGYSTLTLFPDIDEVAELIKKEYLK
ncbi:MAG: FRG domain-containing protein [Polaromonas sp.]|nr:FRG domain-containing protein [Polaromonas sp.]